MHTSFPHQSPVSGFNRWQSAADQLTKVDRLRSVGPQLSRPKQANLLNQLKDAIQEGDDMRGQGIYDYGEQLYGRNFTQEADNLMDILDFSQEYEEVSAINRSLATLGEESEFAA